MIYSYKQESSSAKALAEMLEMKRIRHQGSSFKGSEQKVILNWGASEVPEEVAKCNIINKPHSIRVATNKRKFFEKVAGKVSIPDFTTSKDLAQDWVNEGMTVVGRAILSGHSGQGIVLFGPEEEHNNSWDKCLLFVKYIPKKEEYRVHVVDGEVIGVRRKVKDPKILHPHSWKIRSHNNGFIFQKENLNPDPSIMEESLKAIKEVGLDFGAVDVIWNDFRKKAYVLEINTAPGLEGSTIEEYAEALDKLFSKKQHSHPELKKSLVDWVFVDEDFELVQDAPEF